jgi:hypothetical protein
VVIIRRLIVPLTTAVLAFHAIEAHAQSAFPVPLPGASAAPSAVIEGAPPVGGFPQPGAPQAAVSSDDCTNGILPLRQEAEKRGAMIKAASDRHASPDEACKLIGNYAQNEIKMMKYIESHTQQCGIPAQVGEQLRGAHRNTENMLKKVCDAAKQQHPKWLRIANRLRLSWQPFILEDSMLVGLGNHQSLPEELS